MNILAIDQAKRGGWSVYDYEKKKLKKSGSYDFSTVHENGKKRKAVYDEVIVKVEQFMNDLIKLHNIKYVILEDVPLMSRNAATKPLLRLQGVLIVDLFKQHIPYSLVQPRTWQAYVNKYDKKKLTATQKKYEKYLKTTEPFSKLKKTKQQSLFNVNRLFRKKLDNDDQADAILIGWYAVNNIYIKEGK